MLILNVDNFYIWCQTLGERCLESIEICSSVNWIYISVQCHMSPRVLSFIFWGTLFLFLKCAFFDFKLTGEASC